MNMADDGPLCPSSQPEMPGAEVIGVAGPSGVAMLARPLAVGAVAHLIPDGVPVTEVLRLAAPCVEGHCRHFRDSKCALAGRIAAQLPASVVRPPPCAIRPNCRWWREVGVAACRRCQQIVTEPYHADAPMRAVAMPDGRA
jgi:hypothetical protein